MSRQRELLLNIDRMRREMDEFFGDAWEQPRRLSRRVKEFTPRVDVYYCRPERQGERPRAVVKAELAGVDPEGVSLEISGRRLVISGQRPVRETEGRAYQQVEVPTGPFRREIELGGDVDAQQARATFDDGMLRVEIPLRAADADVRRVPVERND